MFGTYLHLKQPVYSNFICHFGKFKNKVFQLKVVGLSFHFDEYSRRLLVKSKKRSEYSYIGLGDFFSGKCLKICSC